MRKFLRIISCLALTGFLFSCEADDKYPVPFEFEDGGWVKFEEAPNFAVNVANIQEAEFISTIIDPIGNAETYQIDLIATVGGTVMDTVPFRTITTFPAEFNVTPQELAEALDLDLDQLSGGDSFKFIGTVTTEDGRVYTAKAPSYSETAGYNGGFTTPILVDAPGYRNALNFTINFVCPFDASASVGTYKIITDTFETSVGDDTFEVVTGPGANQVTMLNPFDHINPATGQQDYKVIINVNPETGVATVATQAAWHYSNYVPSSTLGTGFVTSSGNSNFVFSCSGAIILNFQHSVSLGTFSGGPYKFVAQKVE